MKILQNILILCFNIEAIALLPFAVILEFFTDVEYAKIGRHR